MEMTFIEDYEKPTVPNTVKKRKVSNNEGLTSLIKDYGLYDIHDFNIEIDDNDVLFFESIGDNHKEKKLMIRIPKRDVKKMFERIYTDL